MAGLMVASLSACGNNAEPQPATDENKTVADQSDMAAPQEIEESTPVYADVLNDGTYDITVESSSSMFNIEACQLTVADGKMPAAMAMGVSRRAQAAMLHIFFHIRCSPLCRMGRSDAALSPSYRRRPWCR